MSAQAEAELNEAHDRAIAARSALETARARERDATVAFITEALHHQWSWERIGRGLAISATAARNYYRRNRYRVEPVRSTVGG
jgi:hypothetical protein